MKRIWAILLTITTAALVAGCSDFGKVDQGRVVKYDKEKGVVTMIRDIANNAQNPDYNHLPPIVYQIPSDPAEMGPEPKAGLRMKLDTKKKQIVLFDPASQGFKTIDYTLVDQQENIDRDHPLVFDKEQNKAKSLPAIDKEKKAVTIYSARQKMLTTFSVPDEYMSLPTSAWDSGDEVRVFYRDEGKAKRLMNISKTNIFKK
jgi:hypothetical protein